MQFIDLARQQLTIRSRIEERIKNILNSGQYIMGQEVFDLEEKLSKYVDISHCITCSSGTDALLMALMSQNIGVGDAVFTTPFTYIATAEVIKFIGATPIFVDICPKTFNVNPNLIQEAVNFSNEKGLKAKAIIPVDIFGLPANYEMIKKVADKNNLFVLEDAAQSFGSKYDEKRACSFGDMAATSFFPAKPLGCYGDGGAIFTNNDYVVETLKSIRIHGSGKDKYENVRLGLNGRLDTLQAAILLEKLTIFDDELNRRNKIADYYTKNLPLSCEIQYVQENSFSSWAQYSILFESNTKRNRMKDLFAKKNIPVMIYYSIPLHQQKVFEYLNYQIGDFPVSEKISKNILSIPMHPYLEENEQDEILEVLHVEN